MASDDPSYYASLFGIGLIVESEFKFSDNVTLRPITLETDIMKLIDRTSSQQNYGFACALAGAVTFELEVAERTPELTAVAAWNLQLILILISIYTRCPVYWPLNGSRCSPGDRDFEIQVGNIFIGYKIFSRPAVVSTSILQKCAESFASYSELLKESRFSDAVSIAATNHNEPKLSIRVAAIWSAIEALLGYDSELRFRIAAATARLLEKHGEGQYKRFKDVRKLYDLRSKCVHGASMKAEDQELAVAESLNLLCEMLTFFIDRGHLPDKSELDRIFFDSF